MSSNPGAQAGLSKAMDPVDETALIVGLSAKRIAIDEQIGAQRRHLAGEHRLEDDSDMDGSPGTLAALLFERYAYAGPIAALDESISLFRATLSPRDNLVFKSELEMADCFGAALCARYLERTVVADLDEAILWHEKALARRVQLCLPMQLSLLGLGRALYWKGQLLLSWNWDEAMEHGNKAIEMLRNALSSSDLHPEIEFQLKYFLARSLISQRGETTNADSQEVMLSDAVIAAPPDHSEYLNVVSFWYRQLINVDPRNQQSVAAIRSLHSVAHATHHPAEHILRYQWASVLLFSLQDSQSRLDKLLEALHRMRSVAEDMSTEHMYYWVNLGNLSAASLFLFQETGHFEYLDEPISRIKAWTSTRKADSAAISNLASALYFRYHVTADQSDIEEATCLYQSCISVLGFHARDADYIHNLAVCKIELFHHRHNDLSLIDQAIELYEIFFTFPAKARRLSDMEGSAGYFIAALCARFEHTKNGMDLERSLKLADDTLMQIPGGHSPPIEVLHYAAIAKRLLGIQQQSLELLGTAVSGHLKVINTATSASISSCKKRGELAITLAEIWKLSGTPENLDRCIAHFLQVLQDSLAPAHERLKYGKEWIVLAVKQDESKWAMKAYHEVLSLLPRLVHLGHRLQSRVTALRPYPGIAIDASVYAINHQDTRTALEWLEVGRALFWRRSLLVHQVFDGIPATLARDLKAKAQILSMIADDDASMMRRRQITNEFDALVDVTRRLPGMENFLCSEPFEKLRECAKKGPVVVLVGNDACSYAVIIGATTTDPLSVHLPAVTPAKFASWHDAADAYVSHSREMLDSLTDEDRRIIRTKIRPNIDLTSVLSEIWSTIMLPVIQSLGLQKNVQSPPRIWLCPVGKFVFLPLHAAGVHSSTGQDSLLDYCVVSYIPSVEALNNARRNAPQPDFYRAKLLLVAEPNAPGLPSLPNTVTEANLVAATLPSEVEIVTFIGKTTVKNVTQNLSRTSIVHLACHAQQHKLDPLESGFMLGDGKLTVSMLAQIKMHRASIAFLSACESAAGDRTLPDEAVHLAAAMLFMGFRSIVGTMWNMHDADGPIVMKHIYKEMFRTDTEPSYDVVPRALHAAICQLRSEGVPAIRWATYIHMGV